MLYCVVQKIIQQLSQHIAVGYNVAHLVEQLPVKESAVGSNPTIDKNAKTDSVMCENRLILDTQVNQV